MSLSLFYLWSKALAGMASLLVSPESQHFDSVTVPPSASVEKPIGSLCNFPHMWWVLSLLSDACTHVWACRGSLRTISDIIPRVSSIIASETASLTRNSPSRLGRLTSGPQEFTCLYLPCSGIADPHVCPWSTGSEDWPRCSRLLSEHFADRAISQLLFPCF